MAGEIPKPMPVADEAALAAANLADLLQSDAFSAPVLQETGGLLPVVQRFRKLLDEFEGLVIENARAVGNQPVADYLTGNHIPKAATSDDQEQDSDHLSDPFDGTNLIGEGEEHFTYQGEWDIVPGSLEGLNNYG